MTHGSKVSFKSEGVESASSSVGLGLGTKHFCLTLSGQAVPGPAQIQDRDLVSPKEEHEKAHVCLELAST